MAFKVLLGLRKLDVERAFLLIAWQPIVDTIKVVLSLGLLSKGEATVEQSLGSPHTMSLI